MRYDEGMCEGDEIAMVSGMYRFQTEGRQGGTYGRFQLHGQGKGMEVKCGEQER